jgi:TRAP-type C4-dicarboxylate transport system permease small subunit
MRLFVTRLSNAMIAIAGFILLVMGALTFADVVMRYFRKPILGTYELVGFMGAAVVALTLPRASLKNAHVYVDLVVDKLPVGWHKTFRIFTRILVFVMFLVGTWYFILMARNFIMTKTVSSSLRVPFYPVVFALAFGCCVQCLVSIVEILEEKGGKR